VLCPRRGGAFKPTNDSRWAHTFCGRNAPGQTRVSAGGVVEIRLIPKDCKKVKCGVCNRQQGACVRCAYLGCTTYFHPLCAERGGKGYLRTRLGEREAFCHQHIPEGLDRCEGYLVDGPEIHRLRISLDRSRVILDTLLRREKFKLRLCKLEGEHFSSTFFRTLDRAKGRKHENSLENVGAGESESEYGDDDYGDEEGSEDDEEGAGDEASPAVPLVPEAVPEAAATAALKKGKPKSKDKAPVVQVDEFQHCAIDFKRNRGEDVTVTVKGRELQISGAWTKGKEINMPKRLGVLVVGLPIQRRDITIEGGRKAFLRILKEKVEANRAASRSQSDMFSSQRDAAEFGKKLGPSLVKHMAMSEAEFSEAMGRMHILAYPDFDKMVQKQAAKALKATQKLMKLKGSGTSSGAPPKPLGLYDLPLEIEAKRRKTVQPVAYFEEPEADDLEGVSTSILGNDDEVDEDFLSSDFFMTDKEAENELDFGFLGGLDSSLSSGLGHEKDIAPIRPKDKRVRIRAPRDRSRDRPRKKSNDGKNGSAVSVSEPNATSSAGAGAGSSSSSKGSSRVLPQAPLCPLDLSMIVIPVKGRKRDIERALKRKKMADEASAREAVQRAGRSISLPSMPISCAHLPCICV
jgi:PHD-zinc-finger like domain